MGTPVGGAELPGSGAEASGQFAAAAGGAPAPPPAAGAEGAASVEHPASPRAATATLASSALGRSCIGGLHPVVGGEPRFSGEIMAPHPRGVNIRPATIR